ncbi:MAG: glycoside hydrolase family 9 protein, partial [bacterium]
MKAIILFLAGFILSNHSYAMPPAVDNHIKIDQFGYRTTDKKIAVISNPISGYNNTSPFTPGSNYQIRKWSDDAIVFTGTITTWNGGTAQTQSGDKVWWFDFSSVTASGTYYVFDVTKNVGSYQFEIGDQIYLNTLKQAMRVFYYQRCGTGKVIPYAQNGWTDAACHVGSLQDLDCRLYNNNNISTSKNLSGGWHDAGDYNKYVNFTFDPVMDLLLAYKENSSMWEDDYNIPESGNGIPDILDEVKYELDWLLKMQDANGSVLSIVGVTNFGSGSPPSADHNQRFYGPATTSATFTASALFALGAIEFKSIGQTVFANTLETASINAWNWATANPNITFYNAGIIGAGEQEVDNYNKLVRQMAASVFLFAHTGNAAYKTFFENNYTQMHLIQWTFAYPFENTAQNMMLYYASLPGASSSISSVIKNAYLNSMKTNNADNLPAYINKTDAYRAYLSNQNYTWGSNTTKGRQGIMFNNMIVYNLDSANKSNYREAALGFINYFNGINPTAFCYLTNMGNYGAEYSITKIYHSWFENVPPPGFVSGGPNPFYSLDGCCPSGCGSSNSLCAPALVTPPLGQPIQKSYKDWNTSWPQNSWTITEPAIYTQATYARLISQFIKASSAIEIKVIIQGFYNSVLNSMNRDDTVRGYLRNVSSPYNIVDSSKAVVDSLNFSGSFLFSNLTSGTYYIVVKHRNSIETWSKSGGESILASVTFNYDFTDASSKAYGNNIKQIDTSPVRFGIYSGDVNQDGTVDLSDVQLIDNDSYNFANGYVRTDINGDNSVDVSD